MSRKETSEKMEKFKRGGYFKMGLHALLGSVVVT